MEKNQRILQKRWTKRKSNTILDERIARRANLTDYYLFIKHIIIILEYLNNENEQKK